MTTTDTASATAVPITRSTLTLRYTQLMKALAIAADQHRVQPIVARVALALHERGGQATGDELATDLRLNESTVRRLLGYMCAVGLVVCDAVDGGPRRAGVDIRARLTNGGRSLASAVITCHAGDRRST